MRMLDRRNLDRRQAMKMLGAAGATATVSGCLDSGQGQTPEEGGESGGDYGGGSGDDGLAEAKSPDLDTIAADPTDVPDPVDWDEPRHHEITMSCSNYVAEIEPGVTFEYMTFEDQVPGPMVRVRKGDTVHLTLENDIDSKYPHNIDFHAVYGPGGGASDTTIGPGESAEIEFSPQYPGVHIYHCAVPNMDHHISAGMFGAILVEPEEGLPEVDREIYMGQHEVYTTGDTGEDGHHEWNLDTAVNEEPTYVLVNGEKGRFTEGGDHGRIQVEQDERIRLYLSNGGPNLISSWHAIGNVWETLYRDGDLTSAPDRYVETVPVAPGTVTAAEIETPVPGPIKLVDHALSRVVRKGRLAVLKVDGEPRPDIYDPDPE